MFDKELYYSKIAVENLNLTDSDYYANEAQFELAQAYHNTGDYISARKILDDLREKLNNLSGIKL